MPTPFRPRSQWMPCLMELRAALKSEISKDMSTLSRRLRDEIIATFYRDRCFIALGCGQSAAHPLHIHFMSD
eukprot:3208955-Pleurochrysis_carterae.AAC.1